MTIDELTYRIIGAAMTVHSELGPGLVEKAYDVCLREQLDRAGLHHEPQKQVPFLRHGKPLPRGFRLDYVVGDCVVVEIKAVENVHPLHVAQLLSYLKIAGYTIGLIINFRVVHLRDGIRRVVNGYVPGTEVPPALASSAPSASSSNE